MIKLESITVTFEQDGRLVKAVDNVKLNICKGSIYGIIGYSGAGKSTLVRTINLLQRPNQEGKVYVSNVDLMSLSQKELRKARKKIGMIFQQFNLMTHLSVFQNVAFPLKYSGLSKEDIKDKVNDLLTLVGLGDKGHQYPRQLSGGQKQRVAIARALASDPDVLLCDEATSALDPKTTAAILELLKKVNQKLGVTIVLITHEMQVVKDICDRVAIMENGRLIEEGTILDIFTQPRHELTKSFIDTATHINKGIQTVLNHEPLLNLKVGDVLVKISFVGEETGQPLVSKLTEMYHVHANILFGNIEIIQNTPVGTLLVGLSGESEDIDKAIQYIRDSRSTIDILEDRRESEL